MIRMIDTDTIELVRKQFVVTTGAGLFSSDDPRFSSSVLAAEGPCDAVAPVLASQAARDRTAAAAYFSPHASLALPSTRR